MPMNYPMILPMVKPLRGDEIIARHANHAHNQSHYRGNFATVFADGETHHNFAFNGETAIRSRIQRPIAGRHASAVIMPIKSALMMIWRCACFPIMMSKLIWGKEKFHDAQAVFIWDDAYMSAMHYGPRAFIKNNCRSRNRHGGDYRMQRRDIITGKTPNPALKEVMQRLREQTKVSAIATLFQMGARDFRFLKFGCKRPPFHMMGGVCNTASTARAIFMIFGISQKMTAIWGNEFMEIPFPQCGQPPAIDKKDAPT